MDHCQRLNHRISTGRTLIIPPFSSTLHSTHIIFSTTLPFSQHLHTTLLYTPPCPPHNSTLHTTYPLPTPSLHTIHFPHELTLHTTSPNTLPQPSTQPYSTHYNTLHITPPSTPPTPSTPPAFYTTTLSTPTLPSHSSSTPPTLFTTPLSTPTHPLKRPLHHPSFQHPTKPRRSILLLRVRFTCQSSRASDSRVPIPNLQQWPTQHNKHLLPLRNSPMYICTLGNVVTHCSNLGGII